VTNPFDASVHAMRRQPDGERRDRMRTIIPTPPAEPSTSLI
jgi:hypothetical protein